MSVLFHRDLLPPKLITCINAKEKEPCALKLSDSNKIEQDKKLEEMWFALLCFSPCKLLNKQRPRSPEVLYCASCVHFLNLFLRISQPPQFSESCGGKMQLDHLSPCRPGSRMAVLPALLRVADLRSWQRDSGQQVAASSCPWPEGHHSPWFGFSNWGCTVSPLYLLTLRNRISAGGVRWFSDLCVYWDYSARWWDPNHAGVLYVRAVRASQMYFQSDTIFTFHTNVRS